MAGINLTPQRRSQLLELLLSQQAQRPQIQTGLEAALRLGAQGVRQRGINQLKEREASAQKTRGAKEAATLAALMGGGAQDFQGRPITDAQGTQQPGNLQEQLSQLMTQNPDSPVGQAIAAAQIQKAFTEPKPPEAPKMTTKQFREGEFFVTREVINGVPGKELSRSKIDRRQQVEQGPPGSFGTESQLGALQIDLNDQVAAVNAFGSQAQRLLKVVRDTEGANTLTAQLANVGNRIRNEVKTFANTFKVDFESGEDAFNPEKYEGVFSAAGLAGANTRVKNGYLALAIQRAIASGLGSGRALSDKDIESQLVTLGRNQSDPSIIANIFQDSFQSVSDNVRFRSEAQSLKLPEIKEFDFGASGSANAARSFLDELRRSRERNASGDTTN